MTILAQLALFDVATVVSGAADSRLGDSNAESVDSHVNSSMTPSYNGYLAEEVRIFHGRHLAQDQLIGKLGDSDSHELSSRKVQSYT